METKFYALDKTGNEKEISHGISRLIFFGISGNKKELAGLCVTNPKAAYCLGRALAARFAKDIGNYEKWKNSMICAIMDFEIDGYKIIIDGIEMLFGIKDVQIDNVILQNQYRISKEKVNGKIVIDGGANTGVFSIFAAKLGAKKVYAFEPIAENIELIRRNAEKMESKALLSQCRWRLGIKNLRLKLNTQEVETLQPHLHCRIRNTEAQ